MVAVEVVAFAVAVGEQGQERLKSVRRGPLDEVASPPAVGSVEYPQAVEACE